MLKILTTVLTLGLVSTTLQAESTPTISIQRLSMEMALSIAQEAVASCRKQGIQIGVTVVDRNGTVQAALRDTIAAPITLKISREISIK